jgi:hypothetical protein
MCGLCLEPHYEHYKQLDSNSTDRTYFKGLFFWPSGPQTILGCCSSGPSGPQAILILVFDALPAKERFRSSCLFRLRFLLLLVGLSNRPACSI